MLKKIITCILVLLMMATNTAVLAETTAPIKIDEVHTENGDSVITYPQLSGMVDEEIQKKINEDILLSANITKHFITLSTIKNSLWGLNVTYKTYLQNDVFSTVISAFGKMPDGHEGQAYTALSYDLATGERLTLKDIFSDVAAASKRMEEIAVATLSEEISGYMEHSELTPLPAESFFIDQEGITFYYAADQFQHTSGYGGACQFYYEELSGLLRADEEGIPMRIEALPKVYTKAQTKELVQKAVTDGTLSYVPVKIGDSMMEVADAYRLLRSPDKFPGGRYFLMEASQFRQVLIISDSIESGYERSVVEGIQAKRGSLYGLLIGQTMQSEWRDILGTPDQTIVFSENMAYDYNLPIGESDLYHFGAHELRLHRDSDGVLSAIQLSK